MAAGVLCQQLLLLLLQSCLIYLLLLLLLLLLLQVLHARRTATHEHLLIAELVLVLVMLVRLT